MMFNIWRWLKDYPSTSLEVCGNTTKYISLDKDMNPSIAREGIFEGGDRNILLNLKEEYLGVILLNVENSVGKKYIRNHLKWELKKKLPEDMNFDFDYKKVSRERYLVKYYRKDTLTQIKEAHKLENVIISSSVIGYYNYWNYHKKNMELEVDDLLLISLGKEFSYLLFIERGELSYIRRIKIGQQDLESSTKRSKFIKEVDHTLMLQEKDIERIFLLGERSAVGELQGPLKNFLETEVSEVDVEEEMVPYISMLGNLYSYHL